MACFGRNLAIILIDICAFGPHLNQRSLLSKSLWLRHGKPIGTKYWLLVDDPPIEFQSQLPTRLSPQLNDQDPSEHLEQITNVLHTVTDIPRHVRFTNDEYFRRQLLLTALRSIPLDAVRSWACKSLKHQLTMSLRNERIGECSEMKGTPTMEDTCSFAEIIESSGPRKSAVGEMMKVAGGPVIYSQGSRLASWLSTSGSLFVLFQFDSSCFTHARM